MDINYSNNNVQFEKYLDGQVGSVRYISNKTFQKALDNGELQKVVLGKTSLKPVTQRKNNQSLFVVSANEQYALSECPLSRVVGYIPAGNGFVEYRKFNLAYMGVAALAVAAVAGVSIGIFSLANKNVPPDVPAYTESIQTTSPASTTPEYDPSQTDKPIETEPAPTQESISFPSITMPGYSNLKMAANTTHVTTISLWNPAQNEGWYDMVFNFCVDVDKDGEFETLYKSGKVKAGNRINEFDISQPLKAGTYDVKIMLYPYYVEDDTITLNNGALSVQLIVE